MSSWFSTTQKRAWLIQFVVILAIALTGFILFSNAKHNLQTQNISSGFNFLSQEAGFAINQSLIEYSSENSYGKAIVVGFLNTGLVAVIGIIGALFLGIFLGIGRMSSNWLVSKLSATYIEIFRNIPVLLQLFFWYALITELLPRAHNALSPIENFFISNKGIVMPLPQFDGIGIAIYFAAAFAAFAGVVIKFYSNRLRETTGKELPVFFYASMAFALGFIFAILMSDSALGFELPTKTRFGFQGGLQLSPEFLAVLLGLMLYTAAFIGEIVRSGIQSVSKGQTEAAVSLGLKPRKILSLIILPQAMRVIIPPLTNQMLNLTKNSSLAVAVGYPDLVNIAQTTMNQTGQAIEAISILMLVYLTLSLLTSLAMNWYNHKVKLIEK